MPSQEHEIPLKLIRNAPEAVPALLSESLGFAVPEHTEAILASAEATDSKPRPYTADGAVLLRAGTDNVLAVVVERQHRWRQDKFWTWPVYLTTVRSQLRCPTVLLVLCPTDKIARDCSGAIPLGREQDLITPLVVGPANTPVITDPEQARAMPELTVFSAKAHGDQDLRTLDAVMEALDSIDPENRTFYYDYVLAERSATARKYLEDLMAVGTYQWQSDFARKYVSQGREEGREEGREALANGVIAVLSARGLTVSEAVRERLESCDDLHTLESWLPKAVTVSHPEELFG